MLNQLIRQLATLKQQQLQAQFDRAQAEIEEIDRQIAEHNVELERLKAQQQALFKDLN